MTDFDDPLDPPAGTWQREHVDRYVASGGADGHLWNGVPTLLLTTRGRRSGRPRRTPLIYGRDGDDYVVVASAGGSPTAPAWYLNLSADPRVRVQVKDDVFDAVARTASAEEKARLWPVMTAIWPAYDEYQAKTSRQIPIVILSRA
ncbi:MAG: nitroreductase family deazaflavin-dependent oxidoreductase [Actinobacteria bacterium]|nr:MAG: nitroreductase family deazaflavin-dependent oxidoreductase [Actinomycetota bacterium]